MKTWRQFVINYPLTSFFILSYALGWSTVIPMKGGLLPYGPTLAAVIVLVATMGRRGISDLLHKMKLRHVPWIWFLIAPGIVVAFHLGAFVLNLLLGATVVSAGNSHSLPSIMQLTLLLVLTGGMSEEPGWSGYALPRLQERYAGRPAGSLVANLILGALRTGWHLPLVLYNTIPWYEWIFYILAFQFLITWLYNQTNGSLPIVMLFHLASNVLYPFMITFYSGADQVRYYWLFIMFAWLIVLWLPFLSANQRVFWGKASTGKL
jgi:hypothetical protein